MRRLRPPLVTMALSPAHADLAAWVSENGGYVHPAVEPVDRCPCLSRHCACAHIRCAHTDQHARWAHAGAKQGLACRCRRPCRPDRCMRLGCMHTSAPCTQTSRTRRACIRRQAWVQAEARGTQVLVALPPRLQVSVDLLAGDDAVAVDNEVPANKWDVKLGLTLLAIMHQSGVRCAGGLLRPLVCCKQGKCGALYI